MLTVQFGNFSKRKNSTARPATLAESFSVLLKENCSIDNPVFKLTAAAFDYNYCKWGEHYYFVVDIVSERNNGWSVTCELDLMATYRTEIHNTSAYVERASGGNGDIQDEFVIPTAPTENISVTKDIGVSTTGCFLLSCVGKTGVQTYILSASELTGLLEDIQTWADDLIQPAGSEVEVLKKIGVQIISAGSAMDCIRDCRWIPFTNIPGALPESISLGLYEIERNPLYVTTPITTKTFEIEIPFSRDGYLRLKPYTEVMLYLPFVGNVVIDTPRLASTKNLFIVMARNNRSGEVAYQVRVGGETVGCYGGATAIPVPVGISNITPQSLIASIGGAAVAAAYNPIGAVGTALSMQSSVSCVGAIQGGAGAGLPSNIMLNVIERGVSGNPANMSATQGVPVYAQRRIGDISGYVRTRGVSVSGALHGDQYDKINAILDSGAFIE